MNETSGFRRVARDIADLCELQLHLFSIDSQQAKKQLARSAALATVSLALAGSALTSAILGGGWLLHDVLEWSPGASILIVAVVVLLLAAILAWLALRSVQSAGSALQESKSELAENLKWLKGTLLAPDRSPRNQYRADGFHSRYAAGTEDAHTDPTSCSDTNAASVSTPYPTGR